MKYKFASYRLFDIDFAVIVIPPDEAVTTTPLLAYALGVSQKVLRNNYERHTDQFNPLRIGAPARGHYSKVGELIKENKEALRLKRMNQELILWTEEDMYTHCQLSKSLRAIQFMRQNMRHLKEWRRANVQLSILTPEQQERMLIENEELKLALVSLTARVEQIEEANPHIKRTASLAGGLLAAQRGTKAIRSLN